MSVVIYLHGLNSSVNSDLANSLREEYGNDLIAIELPANPATWGETIEPIVKAQTEDVTIVASSTAGLFGQYFANKYNTELVLINPVVETDQMKQFIGKNVIYDTGEEWYFSLIDIALMEKYKTAVNMGAAVIILGMDDDIISPKAAAEKYRNHAHVVRYAKEGHRLPYSCVRSFIRNAYEGVTICH